METYVVSGPFAVCEVEPGHPVTSERLAAAGAQVEPLIAAGHLKPAKAVAVGKPPKEQP